MRSFFAAIDLLLILFVVLSIGLLVYLIVCGLIDYFTEKKK